MVTPEDQLRAFGTRLRAVREERSLSQEALADLAGVHRTYISGIELGRRNVGLLNVFRLAAALDLAPAELLAEAD